MGLALVGIGGALVLTTVIVVAVVSTRSTTATVESATRRLPGNPAFSWPAENSSRAAAPTLPLITLHF